MEQMIGIDQYYLQEPSGSPVCHRECNRH